MANNAKSYDIHERIFTFVVRVIKFINKLPRNPTNLIFINQSTRSVTSMGANDQEADGALTKSDFMHCFTIVRKEGKEIVAIVSTIVRNASENKKTRKY